MTPEELKNIAPNLFELKKLENGFSTPKNYFDSIEENVFSSIVLDSIGKKNSFEIPDNYFSLVEPSVLEKIRREDDLVPSSYFDSIEDRVFEKIKTEPKVVSFRKNIIQKIIPLAAAASIVLMITLQFFNANQNNDFASIDVDDIEFWIENGDLNFSDSELAFLYEETEIETVSVFDFYEEDEVFEYLNELDVESLILTN